jgi:hypothetical protein
MPLAMISSSILVHLALRGRFAAHLQEPVDVLHRMGVHISSLLICCQCFKALPEIVLPRNASQL